MTSNPQIISDLELIKEAKHDLELLTSYKGVPFVCKAKIERIDKDEILVVTEDPTIIALRSDKQPRVLGSDYFEPTIARVVSCDIFTGQVRLNNFSYLGTKLGERTIVRVQPQNTIDVMIENERKEIKSQLADISINGMGIEVGLSEYLPSLKPGTSVKFRMTLPQEEIQLTGTILSAIKKAELYRLSIRFDQNGAQKTSIFRYMVDRRKEIEKELEAEYKKATQAS